MPKNSLDEARLPRWYFGGIAASASVVCTHPLDLLKVQLQTSQEKIGIFPLIKQITKEHGILSFYNGLSASVLRQSTYSLARFGIYEIGKPFFSTNTFLGKVTLAGISGVIGGFIGTPADLINVRMQNDIKLQAKDRRNYKHAFDGILRVLNEEGLKRLFSGTSLASVRGGLMTIGQIAFYDQIKHIMIKNNCKDNASTHFISSLGAGAIATTLTQPLDILKTRLMNAPSGEFKGFLDVFRHTAKQGPLAFFKGYIPSFVRVAPSTIVLFMIFEQLRLRFGYLPEVDNTIKKNE